MGIRSKIKKETRLEVFKKYGKKCAYCGEKIDTKTFVVDHIMPVYRNGTNDIENLNPSCRSCNGHKDTFLIEEFREQISLKFNRELKKSTNLRLLKRFGLIRETKKDIVFYFEKHLK